MMIVIVFYKINKERIKDTLKIIINDDYNSNKDILKDTLLSLVY